MNRTIQPFEHDGQNHPHESARASAPVLSEDDIHQGRRPVALDPAVLAAALHPDPSMMVRIQSVHRDAQVPRYASAGAACFDLVAVDVLGLSFAEVSVVRSIAHAGPHSEIIRPGKSLVIRTGLRFEVPEGFAMQIFGRSGDGFKRDVSLSNCVGIIDSDYRGEVSVKLRNDGEDPVTITSGDRIAQAWIVPVPRVHFVEVAGLTETARGAGGFGSTGR